MKTPAFRASVFCKKCNCRLPTVMNLEEHTVVRKICACKDKDVVRELNSFAIDIYRNTSCKQNG